MLKRHARSTFGSVYVFPGGVVDACDARCHGFCGGIDEEHARALLGVNDALDFYSAAVREVFEETGVLLARRAEPADPGSAADSRVNDADRQDLINGEISWDTLLRQKGLTLSGEQIHYFAHWLTPSSEPNRFSTRFFLAAMPGGQHASHDGFELTDSCWMTASGVLESQRKGNMLLIFPTYRTLKEIAGLRSVDEIIDWAIGRQRSGVARVMPAIVEVDGKDKVVMPGDPRYPKDGLA
jgi:8-oxo-dGTP pyrophosphatase MutT (NUDIX family)